MLELAGRFLLADMPTQPLLQSRMVPGLAGDSVRGCFLCGAVAHRTRNLPDGAALSKSFFRIKCPPFPLREIVGSRCWLPERRIMADQTVVLRKAEIRVSSRSLARVIGQLQRKGHLLKDAKGNLGVCWKCGSPIFATEAYGADDGEAGAMKFSCERCASGVKGDGTR